MSAPLSSAPAARRTGGRALLAIVMAVTALAALATIVNDIVRIAYLLRDGYSFEASVLSPGGIPADLPADTAQTTSQFWTVLISTSEPVTTAPQLQITAIAVTAATVVAAAAVIVLLCVRLWTGRTFSASTAVGMLTLGALALIVAVLAPWLQHRADTIALEQLGYAQRGGDRWVQLRAFDLGSIDAALLTLGLVLMLATLVYLGARRLQRDTEGLV